VIPTKVGTKVGAKECIVLSLRRRIRNMSPSDHRPEDTIAAHYEEAVQWRRQLHRNPQPAWLEFYSTGFVAEKLAEWGYGLQLGNDIIAADRRMVVPDSQTLEAEYDR